MQLPSFLAALLPSSRSMLPPRPPAPGPGRRAELLLIQILVAIVLSYHLLLSHEAHGLYSIKEWVVLGLLLLVAGVMLFPGRVWESSWFVGALVMLDTAVTSTLIYFSPNDESGFHITFFLIILVAASAPTLKQAFILSATLCVGYAGLLYLGPSQVHNLSESELLEIPVLLIMAAFYGVSADTVRRLREKATHVVEVAQESERNFRNLVESARDAIIQSDSQGRVLWWNQAAEAVFGYQAHEMLGQPLVNLMPERYREAHLKGIERFRQSGQSHMLGRTVEIEGLRKDGTEFPVELSVVATGSGAEARFSGILRDLTERKRLDAIVRQREEEVRQKQKMEIIGRLAAEVAHDFGQILLVIMGSSQLLLKGRRADDPIYRRVDEIRKAADRGEAITRRLLAFSRKQPLHLRRLNLNRLVTDQVPMIKNLLGPDVHLVTDLAADAGPVLADSGQLDQVLMNLAANARDAMPKGGTLTIKTRNTERGPFNGEDRPAPGSYVLLEVGDTGIGMEAAVLANCFEPFYTTKELGHGTGLGLATVYGIVEQSGGTIEVESEPGLGTTFSVYLPRQDQKEEVEESAKPPDMPRGNETILLVDDDRDVRMLVQEVLNEQGYTVLEVGSPENALFLAEEHPGQIHLLLTDVVMPRMNGKQLAERLSVLRPGIKTLYVSGYSGEILASHGVAEPEALCIPKPFTVETLAGKVREVLDRD